MSTAEFLFNLLPSSQSDSEIYIAGDIYDQLCDSPSDSRICEYVSTFDAVVAEMNSTFEG